jgi:hypothetical protein
MSSSASADLFFGIILHDENNDDLPVTVPWIDKDGEGDFEAYAADHVFGLNRPDAPYSAETKSLFQEYWATRRELLKDLPVEEDHVGYMDGGSVRVLKLKDWGAWVPDYGCEDVGPARLVVTGEQRHKFALAVESLGIRNAPEPTIMLAASYG